MGQSTTEVQRSNMSRLLVVILMPLCLGSPLEGFGDATDVENAEIREGTYLEGFDENPQYNFNYKVADDVEQTYIAMDEARDGENVRGSYSYVDPLGSLISVTYSAGLEGYQETREIQENFITINQRPANRATVSVDISANSRLQAQRAEETRLQAQSLKLLDLKPGEQRLVDLMLKGHKLLELKLREPKQQDLKPREQSLPALPPLSRTVLTYLPR